MQQSFFEDFLNMIIEQRMMPYVQIERTIENLLTLFISEVITLALQDDSELSGEIVLISEEFPLKNKGDDGSSHIDWLMYNKTRKQLLLVELKTSELPNDDGGQNEKYINRKERIFHNSGRHLVTELRGISGPQYRFIEDVKVSPYINEIIMCEDAKIIYLVPEMTRDTVQHNFHPDKILSFQDLPEQIQGPYASEWILLRKYLQMLDYEPEGLEKYKTVEERNRGGKKTDFFGIIDKCKKDGNTIVVGFEGGEDKMRKRNISYLIYERKYQWKDAKIRHGSNWFPGNEFLEMVKKVIQQT